MIEKYDFYHTGLMKDSRQSIPLGNGDLGVNVWVQEDGAVSLLLSKTDAWSENCRLLKTGYLKLFCDPCPFNGNTRFHLSLQEGMLSIRTDAGVSFRIWVDANLPVYHVEFEADEPVSCRAVIINYRDRERLLHSNDDSNYLSFYYPNLEEPHVCDSRESADVVFTRDEHSMGQYHRNLWSAYDFSLRFQGLEDYPGRRDPLLFLTFGYMMYSGDMRCEEDGLATAAPVKKLQLEIASAAVQCELAETWMKTVCDIRSRNDDRRERRYAEHCAYWAGAWERSRIYASGSEKAELFTRGYLYQRYMNLCAGRGAQPIKFNGSLFTVEPSPFVQDRVDYDYRQWGGLYWFQNTRLIYWNMLFAGDFEEVRPFLNMYLSNRDFFRYRTKEYFSHEGLYFPETMTHFGLYSNNNYGWDRKNRHKSFCENRCIRYYYSCSLEFVLLALTYCRSAGDRDMLQEVLPFAQDVLTFFIQHFEVRQGSDKRMFSPTAALETWKECVDDTPTIAGICAVTDWLLSLEGISAELAETCRLLRDTLPDLPLELSRDGQRQVIAPCRVRLDFYCNVENPELYAVFPYRRYGLGKEQLQLAVDTYFNRTNTASCGWQQHAVQAALLGLREEAERGISANYSQVNPNCIFPSYFGPNYDWLPDQDTGSVAGIALISCLVQADCGEIRLLPVWDMQNDVEFRLPVGDGNFVELIYRGGRVLKLRFDREPACAVTIAGETVCPPAIGS